MRNVRHPSDPHARPLAVLPVHVEPTVVEDFVLRVGGQQLRPMQRMLGSEGAQFVALESQDVPGLLEVFTGPAPAPDASPEDMVLFETHTATNARPFKQNKYATIEIGGEPRVATARNVPVALEALHHMNKVVSDMRRSFVLE